MAGVFEALVATAVGLCVAIPAIVFFNSFQRKVKATMSQVDRLAHLVLTFVPAQKTRPARSAAYSGGRGITMAGAAASSFGDEDGGVISDINVTPLVDVVLVLLIVFMITVPAIVGSAPIKVDVPESSSSGIGDVEQLPLNLFIKKEDGAIVLYVNESKTDVASFPKLVNSIRTPGVEQPVYLSGRQIDPLCGSHQGHRHARGIAHAQAVADDQAHQWQVAKFTVTKYFDLGASLRAFFRMAGLSRASHDAITQSVVRTLVYDGRESASTRLRRCGKSVRQRARRAASGRRSTRSASAQASGAAARRPAQPAVAVYPAPGSGRTTAEPAAPLRPIVVKSTPDKHDFGVKRRHDDDEQRSWRSGLAKRRAGWSARSSTCCC